MDLFAPVVEPCQFHPNFKNALNDAYRGAREILSSWSDCFVDRDGKFVREFQTTFNSAFWELYIYAVLKHLRFTVDFGFPAPDFVVTKPYEFCVEAVTAQAASGTPNEWEMRLKTFWGDLHSLSLAPLVDQATIRLANAISGKHEKFRAQYASLQHVAGKPFVLAVAPFEQPFFYLQLNRAILRVLFSYDGAMLNDESGEEEARFKGSIRKPNGSDIRLGYFLNDGMEEISAVLFSNTATFGKLQALHTDTTQNVIFRVLRLDGTTRKLVQTVHEKLSYKETLLDGLSVYYNPFAKYPLDQGVFGSPEVAHYMFEPRTATFHFDVPHGALFHHLSATIVSKRQPPKP